MDNETIFVILVCNLILCLIVGWAATQRGRDSMHWFALSLFISPILALLVLMAVGSAKKKDADLSIPDYLVWKQQTQAVLVPTPAMQAAALPKPLLSKWHIARGEETLGEYSIGQITDLYRAGALTPSDLYWDTQAHEWLELAAHPRLT
jgi:hypothetical protein